MKNLVPVIQENMNNICSSCPMNSCKYWYVNPWLIDKHNTAANPTSGVPILVVGNNVAGEDLQGGRHLCTEWGEWLYGFMSMFEEAWCYTTLFRCYPTEDDWLAIKSQTENSSSFNPKKAYSWSKRSRKIEKEARSNCSKHLDILVSNLKPKLIICLGEAVGQYVLGTTMRLSEMRGEIMGSIYKGVNALVLTHPAMHSAFIPVSQGGMDLRNEYKAALPLAYTYCKDHIHLDLSDSNLNYRVIELDEMNCGVLSEIESFAGKDVLSYDCETENVHPVIHHPDNRLLCVGFGLPNGKNYVFNVRDWSHKYKIALFNRTLKGQTLVGTNIAYDLQWVWRGTNGIVDPRDLVAGVHDTMFLGFLRNQMGWSNGLEPQVKRFLGRPGWKKTVTRKFREVEASEWWKKLKKFDHKLHYGHLYDYDQNFLLKYQAKDTNEQRLLWEYWKGDHEELNNPVYKLMIDAMWAFLEIERVGLRVDTKAMERLKSRFEKRISNVQEQLDRHYYTRKAGLSSINVKSTMQLTKVAEAMKITTKRKSEKTDMPTLDQEEVIRQAGQGKTIKEQYWTAVLGIRKLRDKISKFITKYAEYALPDKHGVTRVRPRVHMTKSDASSGDAKDVGAGIGTGRIAFSDPSTHLIIKSTDIRDCYPATEGWTLCEIDMVGAEVLVLGLAAEDPNILDIFRRKAEDPDDPRADIYKVGVVNFPKWGVTWDDWVYRESEVMPYRKISKRIILGLNYLQSPTGLAMAYGIPLEIATEFADSHFSAYPSLQKYIASSLDLIFRGKTVTSPSGRKAVFELYNEYDWDFEEMWDIPFYRLTKQLKISEADQHTLRQGYNFRIQSTTSDMTLTLLVLFDKWRRKKELKDVVRAVNFVHDSIWYEVREEYSDKILPLLKKFMEDVSVYQKYSFDLKFPDFKVLTVDSKHGKSLGDILRKS